MIKIIIIIYRDVSRMGQSIELSYSNIQRFVIRYLHPVCQSLHFQLGELIGLARASPRFSVIGNLLPWFKLHISYGSYSCHLD